MASSKKPRNRFAAPNWSLDADLSLPSQDELESVEAFLRANADHARHDGVAELAAFSLIARDPSTGARLFDNSQIAVLSRRNRQVVLSALDALPSSKKLLQPLREAAGVHTAVKPAPAAKTTVKRKV